MEENNSRRNIELQNEPFLTIPRSSSVSAGERNETMKKTWTKEDNMPPLLASASTPTHSKRPNRGTDIKLSRERPATLLSQSIISQQSRQRTPSAVSSQKNRKLGQMMAKSYTDAGALQKEIWFDDRLRSKIAIR